MGVLALNRPFSRAESMSALRGEADMIHCIVPIISDAIDPNRTLGRRWNRFVEYRHLKLNPP